MQLPLQLLGQALTATRQIFQEPVILPDSPEASDGLRSADDRGSGQIFIPLIFGEEVIQFKELSEPENLYQDAN
jgi:hypothetical protein